MTRPRDFRSGPEELTKSGPRLSSGWRPLRVRGTRRGQRLPLTLTPLGPTVDGTNRELRRDSPETDRHAALQRNVEEGQEETVGSSPMLKCGSWMS